MVTRNRELKDISVIFSIGLVFASILYSCSQQRGIAQITTQDTILVPKEWRPSTIALKQMHKQEPVKPLKLPTEEQFQFNKKLNYVLDNAGTSFDNISLIRGDISDLRLLIENRAIVLRNSNDSLTHAILDVKGKQIEAINFAHKESLARIANEKKTEDDRKQNQSNAKAQNLYTSILFAFLVALLIILLLQWLDIRRIKAKYKNQLQYG